MRRILFILSICFIGLGSICAQAPAASDSVMKVCLGQMGIPLTHHNRVQLLPDGKEKFHDLFSAIRQAKHHIHLEYFNFRNDSIAGELFTLLVHKANEGVEVRALFDAFGNCSNNRPLKRRHLVDLRRHGIEIVKFDPFRFPWINHAWHRDHRKLVVIDGRTGYIGGMNIADYYIQGLPKIGPWRDMHARIEGEAVAQLQGVFLTMWNQTTGQHIGGPEYFAAQSTAAGSLTTDLGIDSNATKQIAIVDRKARICPAVMRNAYIAGIDAATRRIRIINPYFTPTPSVRRALRRALKRGTEVEILIPSRCDIAVTPDASKYIAHKLMKRGAKIYLFDGGFHHTKVMTIDSLFCTLGSTNLNSRSLRCDYELNAFIFDVDVTRQLDQIFNQDTLQSTPLTPVYWKKRPLRRKIAGWFGNLLTPLL